MSITYTPTTNFGSKDVLPANDPNKVIVGAEFTSEFNAIQAAFALAAPTSNPTFSGTATYNNLTVSGSFTSRGIDDNADATAITIDANENVGIGTDAPAAMLEVKGSDTSARFRGVGSQLINLDFSDSPSTATMDVRNAATFNISKQGIPSLSIDQERNVGIGTATPVGTNNYGGLTLNGASGGALSFTDDDVLVGNLLSSGSDMYFGTGGDTVFRNGGYTGSDEAMRIDSSGNVGIGEVAPSEFLHISGAAPAIRLDNSSGTTDWLMQNVSDSMRWVSVPSGGGSSVERMRIASDGNVGIGSTNPLSPLTVNSSVSSQVRLERSSNAVGVSMSAIASGGWGLYDFVRDDYDMFMKNGNVGIGTTTPVDQLDVKASGDDERLVRISHPSTPTAAAGYFGFTDTGSGANTGVALGVQYAGDYFNAITVDRETRRVGIGSTSPQHSLDINTGATTRVKTGDGTRSLICGVWSSQPRIQATGADLDITTIGANAINLVTNGADRMHVSSSGNVGVSTTSPAALLDVNATAQAPSPSTFNGMLVGQESGTMAVGSGVGLGFKMRNSSGGNVGGNSVGAAIYGVQATAGVNQGELAFHTRQDNVSLDERMRIDASGNVLVGATTAIGGAAASRVQITHSQTQNALTIKNAGNSRYYFHSVETLSGDYAILNDATVGVKLSYGASAWSAFSDENLKENISDVGPVLDTIKDFQCVNYSLKSTESEAADKVGFIAQDWEHTFPNVVSKDEEGTLSMKYTETIPVLLKAIQELTAKVEALENA